MTTDNNNNRRNPPQDRKNQRFQPPKQNQSRDPNTHPDQRRHQPRNNQKPQGNNPNRHPHQQQTQQRPQNDLPLHVQMRNLPTHRVHQFYTDLLDHHNDCRKKFFEMYYRADYNKVDKLEKNYYQSLKKLRDFENYLKPWQKDEFNKKINFYPEDKEYSLKNPTEKVELQQASLEDQKNTAAHVLISQLNRDTFRQDQEESIGTADDYLKYKNSKSS